MEDKPWYKSKGIWGGILIAVGFIYGNLMGDSAGATAISGIGAGLWGIGIRAAI